MGLPVGLQTVSTAALVNQCCGETSYVDTSQHDHQCISAIAKQLFRCEGIALRTLTVAVQVSWIYVLCVLRGLL